MSGSSNGNGAQRPVAWVTGGSRGMGADIARHLAEAGYDLAITARNQQRLDELAAQAAASRALSPMARGSRSRCANILASRFRRPKRSDRRCSGSSGIPARRGS